MQNATNTATEAGRTAGAAIDDGLITTKVKAALLADDTVKGTDINVETLKGEVMLSGFVESKTQLDRALKIAKDVEGVNKVNNKLAVRSAKK
ncbi:MAG TPA: BON domain-containing protein [Burkholderiaceae bacterium]|nr:BON domain-containing protein [Burkholderiaceae bacterium]